MHRGRPSSQFGIIRTSSCNYVYCSLGYKKSPNTNGMKYFTTYLIEQNSSTFDLDISVRMSAVQRKRKIGQDPPRDEATKYISVWDAEQIKDLLLDM